MAREHYSLGRRGENWVANLVESRGWTVLARNWRRRGVELDIVALRTGDLIILEVKTRRDSRALEDPHRVLSWGKRKAFIRGAHLYLSHEQDLAALSIRLYLAVLLFEGGRFKARWHPIEITDDLV